MLNSCSSPHRLPSLETPHGALYVYANRGYRAVSNLVAIGKGLPVKLSRRRVEFDVFSASYHHTIIKTLVHEHMKWCFLAVRQLDVDTSACNGVQDTTVFNDRFV